MTLTSEQRTCVLDNVLPTPLQCEPGESDLVLNQDCRIIASGKPANGCMFAAERLTALIETEFGLLLPVVHDETGGPCRLYIAADSNSNVADLSAPDHEEGYALHAVGSAAVVCAKTTQGLLHGAMTLRQLVTRVDGQVMLAGVRITDEPRYRWRGFQIDAARAPFPLAVMKRMIRIASAFKLNFVVFREGDDELNAVRYESNSLGSRNPHALSMTDCAEFIEYAEAYGITVIPEVESLGHSAAKGFHYPALVSGGFEERYEGGITHIRKAHLTPGDDAALALLESIYDEWFRVSRTPFIHLGLDEVRLDHEPQARHLARLLPLLDACARRHGRQVRPMVWGDAPPTPEPFRDRVVRCLWSYANPEVGEVGYDNAHLIKQGLAKLSEPGCSEAVMMAGGSESYHVPHKKSAPNDAVANLLSWARWGADRPNFIGLYAVQWGGNMIDEWLPDFLAAADGGWNPGTATTPSVRHMERIRSNLVRLDDAASPRPNEVARPAWDGIWLEDRAWGKDIMGS